MAKAIKNLGASVRARLLNLSKENGQNFDLVLTRFALERVLYRLGESPYANRFVLKGAMLIMIWFDNPYRGTGDLDLLGFGDASEQAILETFREILSLEFDDGIEFYPDSLRIERIREGLDYGCLRLSSFASVAGARIKLKIDIGFGDAIEPGENVVEYPVMLDFPAPRLRTYSRETVIAEKFHAMVELDLSNSRLKDFYDIWILSRSFEFPEIGFRRQFPLRSRDEVPLFHPNRLHL